jgi:hypothetical protein
LSVVTIGPKESVCGKQLVVDALLLAGYDLSFLTLEPCIISSDPLLGKKPVAMANIGSVFLGDFQRLRHLSSSTHSSTPPSSPPPTTMSHVFSSLPHSPVANSSSSPLVHSMKDDVDGPAEAETTTADAPTTRPVTIEPALALELRLRWLEAIVLGVSRERKGKGREGDQDALASPASHSKQGETLVRLAESVQQRLDAAVEGNEGLRRFMEHCLCLFSYVIIYLIFFLSSF